MNDAMYYVNEWSRLNDAAQCIVLFLLAYIMLGVALLTYAIASSIKQWQRERARRRAIYYWRY